MRISETLGQSSLQATLDTGLNTLDRNQTVVFTQYTKTILPADGYVFWLATNNTVTVSGSVHYGIDKEQNEDETLAVNRVIFTAESQIQQFDAVGPTTMYLGVFEGIQFAFSRQGDFYQQSNLWHYVGNAVYPALSSQIINSAESLAALSPIVSNSLPIWLSQNAYAPVYPSFLVPDNIAPPYIVAHVEPDGTDAVQGFPLYDMTVTGNSAALGFFVMGQSQLGVSTLDYGTPVPAGAPIGQFAIGQVIGQIPTGAIGEFEIGVSAIGNTGFFYQPSNQLMQDRVRLTLYGFNNQLAIQYFNSLMQYSLNTDAFGFMNSPAIKDDKRRQVEMGVLAQKKHIDITASYYQSTAAAIAQRLILSAGFTLT